MTSINEHNAKSEMMLFEGAGRRHTRPLQGALVLAIPLTRDDQRSPSSIAYRFRQSLRVCRKHM